MLIGVAIGVIFVVSIVACLSAKCMKRRSYKKFESTFKEAELGRKETIT